MSSNLGVRYAKGKVSRNGYFTPNTNLWVVEFKPTDLVGPSGADFEVYHGSVRGPGGYFLVYLDNSLYGVGENGTVNEYAPSKPMKVRAGQVITLNWSIATGSAPEAWLYLQQSEIS